MLHKKPTYKAPVVGGSRYTFSTSREAKAPEPRAAAEEQKEVRFLGGLVMFGILAIRS